MKKVKLGSDNFNPNYLKSKKVALLVNQTSYDSTFIHLIQKAKKYASKVYVLTPEHGLHGEVPDGKKYGSYYDDVFQTKIISLYQKSFKPPPEVMEDIELIIYDIQDVGLRWYTYISSLFYMLEAADKFGVKAVILDRPNPIGGKIIEGPVLDISLRSYVGIAEIPVRYALTPGELALYFSKFYGFDCEINVVKMTGWKREMWFDETGLHWIPTSPAISTSDTPLYYLITCPMEGTNLNEGRGTTTPFKVFGAPWIKPRELSQELNELKIPGLRFRPVKYMPRWGKYANTICGGVFIHIFEKRKVRGIESCIKILKKISELYKDKLQFLQKYGKYSIDLLIGTPQVRRYLNGKIKEESLKNLIYEWNDFKAARERILLYK